MIVLISHGGVFGKIRPPKEAAYHCGKLVLHVQEGIG